MLQRISFQRLLAFILLTFLLSGMSVYWLLFRSGDQTEQLIALMAYFWSPGLAAIFLQKVVYKKTLKPLGLFSGRFSGKWAIGNVLAPIGVVLGTLGVVFVLGNVAGMPGFGEIDLNREVRVGSHPFYQFSPAYFAFLQPVDNLVTFFGDGMPVAQLLLVLLGVGLFIGPLTGQIFFLGQEIAWRGFVLRETQVLGWQGSSVVTGVLWGLWNLVPAFFVGFIDLQTALVIIGGCVALSLPMSYLSLKSGSIMAAAAFRGVLGIVGAATTVAVIGSDPLYVSPSGLAGMIFLLIATFIVLTRDKELDRRFADWRYEPEENA